MELSKYILTFMLFISAVTAEIDLPEMATKQSTSNLRFISSDGKFTLYQRRSGSLLLSTNYNVEEILKGKEGSQYIVISSPSRKNIIIEQNEHFHTYLSVRKLNKIYSTAYGAQKTKFIGEGVDARLHLNDTWVSFFDPYKMTITFAGLKALGTSFEIKLQNKKNPYFIPQIIMLNDNTVLFTDLNADAVSGIIEFNRSSGKSKLLLKAENEFSKYELCTSKESVFVGMFGTRDISKYSSITKYNKDNFDVSKGSILYDSKYNDRGSIVCNGEDDFIYFVKSIEKEKGVSGFEASSINLENKKVTLLSSLKWVSSIINMDGKLILPYHGKLYLLNSKKEDNLKNSSLNADMEKK